MTWIKTVFLSSVLIIGSCIFGFVLFENFLFYVDKSKPVERILINIHGYNYQFLKSNYTLSPLRLNQDDREFLILGDSFVQGVVCAHDEANFPSHLSQKVKGKFNVVNLGVGGMNTADYIDFLDHFDISSGDVALITLYDNDINFSQKNCKQINRQAEEYDIYVPKLCAKNREFIDKSDVSFLQKVNNKVKNYKTVQLVKETMSQFPSLNKYFYRNEYRKVWNDFGSEENKWMRSSLRIMKRQMISRGGSVLFTYYPNTNRISDKDERHAIWMRFIEFLEKNDGIKISDPYPYFIKNAPEKSMVWSLTDKHPNCAAHRLMSEFIFNNLQINN